MRKLLLLLLFPSLTLAQTQHDRIDARGQVKTDKFVNRATILLTGATPDVSNGNVFKTNNGSVVTVTNFLNGADTQLITVNCGDANTTIQNNANIVNTSGADFACGVNKTISYIYDAAQVKWIQSGTGAAGGGGGGSPGAPGNSLQKNNGSGGFSASGISDSGSLITFSTPVAPTGNVSLKGATSDSVQYVSPNGNDSNDGLSPGTAKLTVVAALKALPGGSSTNAGVGTVLISGSVNASTTSTCGIWLMGVADPNFSSPPACWLKWQPTSGQSLTIDCLGKIGGPAHGHDSTCTMTGGGISDSVHPTIWISATNQTVAIKNISFGGFLNTYIKYGIDSNNARSGATAGSSSFSLNNVGWNHGGCRPGGGPGMDVGSQAFWISMRDIVASGCVKQMFTVGASAAVRASNVVTITTSTAHNIVAGDVVTVTNILDDTFNNSVVVATAADNTHFTYTQTGANTTSGSGYVVTAGAAAINIDPGPGTGSGLIWIDTINLNSGGIRITPGTNGSGVYVRNVSYEGDFADPDMPPFLATSTNFASIIRVENVEVSDNLNAIPDVQIDNAINYSALVSRVDGSLRGKMTYLGGGTQPSPGQIASGKAGFYDGRLVAGGIDAGRRLFSPVAVQSANLATTNPTWGFQVGSGTVTPVAARDGSLGAGRVTASGGQAFPQFYIANGVTLTVGDVYVFGVWARSNTANGYSNNAPPVKFILNANGFGTGDTCAPGPTGAGSVLFPVVSPTDGQWDWISGACKIQTAPVVAGVSLVGVVDTAHTTDFYAPTLVKFAAGTVSNNEMYEIANNLQSLPDNVAAGTVSTLRAQSFAMGTGGGFLIKHGGTLTADRTDLWPDQSGTVAVTSEPFSSSPRAVPPIFFPGALTTTWTGASWTLDKAITVTRVQSAAKVVPAGCSTSAVVRVTDGITPINLTINAATNDSGAVSQNYAAGATLTVSVQTAASGCTTSPGDLNVSIQSRMQ